MTAECQVIRCTSQAEATHVDERGARWGVCGAHEAVLRDETVDRVYDADPEALTIALGGDIPDELIVIEVRETQSVHEPRAAGRTVTRLLLEGVHRVSGRRDHVEVLISSRVLELLRHGDDFLDQIRRGEEPDERFRDG